MKRFVVAVAAIVALAGCTQVGGDAPSPTTPAEITGVWQGDLSGSSGDSYSVKVTIDDPLAQGEQGATAQYRGIGGLTGCSANWVYDEQKQGTWTFTETITDGNCTSSGTVTLTPAQDAALQYLWRAGSDNANGFLTRP